MQQHPTTLRRAQRLALGTLAAVVAACLLLLAAPGWAHVTVNPREAVQGGYTALSFRVPNETDDTSTTKVEVFLPQEHPLASVSVRPHPGWHAKVVTKKLAKPLSTDDGEVTDGVYSITWTADSPATAIKPGEFEEFNVSAGPLPKAPSMVFKTLQTYSDGTVVRWIDQPAAAGQPEPEHPAPVLTLLPASADPASASAGSESDGSDGTAATALVLSIVALLLGAGALGTSLLRRRS
jgi:periplasmic copper chaperone A